MEIGIGFAIGALAGLILVVIINLIISVSRRAMRKGAPATAAPAPSPASGKTTQIRSKESPGSVGKPRSATTVVVAELESREGQLNKNIQEVKELILKLAQVVGKTDDASGKAAEAFNSIRNTIDNINLGESDELLEAQRVLVGEIDRVLKTNAALQTELDQANKGIVEQRRQIEELRVAARMDGLTRVPNRAAFDERLREYAALASRGKIIFTLLLLDIDHFKRVNDEHGHQSGDRILRGVATKIGENVRANDFVARYGGEEFAVLFPATDLGEATVVSERMRQDIARTNFRLDNKTIRVTVSGGLCECRECMDVEAVVEMADQELYKAKNGGRNIISGGQVAASAEK